MKFWRFFVSVSLSFSILSSALLANNEVDEEGSKSSTPPTICYSDPRTDLRLNPTKGETVWAEKSTSIKIPGYPDPFEVDGELEITFLPIASQADCEKVGRLLWMHNQRALHDGKEIFLQSSISGENTIGGMFQSIFAFNSMRSLRELGVETSLRLLKASERAAFEKGAQHVFTIVNEILLPLTFDFSPLSHWMKALTESGYISTGEDWDLKTGSRKHYFQKKLEESAVEEDSIGFSWEESVDEESPFTPPEGSFGFFVRKEGEIKGGLYGKRLQPFDAIPHGEIDVFCLNPDLRKKGLGSILMEYALAHLKSTGATVVELSTTDWQAPGFYRKKGFDEVVTFPIAIEAGQLYLGYVFRKELLP